MATAYILLCAVVHVTLSTPDHVTQSTSSQATSDEHACYSRFDYESKMLERIVMVEHRMNILQEDTKRQLEHFQNVLKHLREDQNANHVEMLKQFEVLESKLLNAQEQRLGELDAVGDKLKNTSDQLVLQHDLMETKIGEKFINISIKLSEDIAERHAESVGEIENFMTNLSTQHQTKMVEIITIGKDLRKMAENMKEEQALKLSVMEAVSVEIKVR